MWTHHTVKQNNYKNKTTWTRCVDRNTQTDTLTHTHTVELKKVPLLAAGGAGQWVCIAGQDAV